MTTPTDDLSWTFLAPGCPRPTGGDIARFELVNALARQGHGSVRVVHVPTDEMWIRDLGDLPWFAFDSSVEHQFAADLDPADIPDADVVVYSTKLLWTALSMGASGAGDRLIEALRGQDRAWLPIAFLQGHGVFPAPVEDLAFDLPGPKVCVGSWLANLLTTRGVPAADVVHIPNGLDHDRFRVVRPIDGRSPRVAMNYDPYPPKRGDVGLEAIDLVRRELPVEATVFGTLPLRRALGPGVSFEFSPTQSVLAEEIYNRASLFLQPSQQEGFGMSAVESMACGCALVTTANGGSDDYAFEGETALVCGSDATEMADALARLSRDDALRVRIAREGQRFVDRFRWATSATDLRRAAIDGRRRSTREGQRPPVDLSEVRRRLAQ